MKRLVPVTLAAVLVACSFAAAPDVPATAPRGLPRTHSHNDYSRPRPLLDALSHGFTSVEADIFLVGTELRISHDRVKDWAAVPTLQQLYLDPLKRLAAARKNAGIYPDGKPMTLLIDIKTEADPTYQRLHEVLAEYQFAHPGLFTDYARHDDGGYGVTSGAINVIISGNRPRDAMARQALRYAAYDGRRADIGPDVKPDDGPEFVAWISDNWNEVFKDLPPWDGTGEMPPAMKRRVAEMAAQVHAEGKMLRFWNVPKDSVPAWAALYDAGVDVLNTDDLPGLAAYVKSRLAVPAK